MLSQIRERCRLEHAEMMDEDWQVDILIGHGWKKKGKEIRERGLEIGL